MYICMYVCMIYLNMNICMYTDIYIRSFCTIPYVLYHSIRKSKIEWKELPPTKNRGPQKAPKTIFRSLQLRPDGTTGV